jgi:hypothetical protein
VQEVQGLARTLDKLRPQAVALEMGRIDTQKARR